MASINNTKMIKIHRHLILRPAKCTNIFNLAHYEKRLDIPGLDVLSNLKNKHVNLLAFLIRNLWSG